ncbi:short transient receptor potential channel 3-like [Anneissia japonica]|uniref:short transient receptor potential channel 3-like n=1 Tax=Anneissia japonica TaxID=1529436 RepID=UPI001425B580|nr:short transient receptor potential channel 3-like [Anneissia japonica]XP_033109651.1 short transient receptor potential channel 3-like [Anneissia japonica]XP_033109652.1 short transient receptor potential channel 3-like [Anneissia japonica]XP_033109653.1 short transient receptor potential channel 3-like [Anneissia japonica]XP_033109654.1 short transient receptor potential channel 3-like [Anneissia japonica]
MPKKRRILYGSSIASTTSEAGEGVDIISIEKEEKTKNILHAAEMGDLITLKEAIENADEAEVEWILQLHDYKDRSILEVATENEHWEIVNYVITNHGQTQKIPWNTVYESLMLAISKGYLRITQSILEHSMFKRGKDRNRLGSISHYFEQVRKNSKFDHDITPLMLAAHYNDIDIIRLFLARGEKIKTPHLSSCNCVACENKRMFDSLKHSKSRINTYKALTSPAYISLTSSDPILTAFDLCRELDILASKEKEFKNVYKELSDTCKEYTSDLLDMCQSSQEVDNLLSGGEGCLDQRERLGRVKLGITYRQKQFVAHAHCQHQLSTLFYGELMSTWKDANIFIRFLMSVGLSLGLPIWIFAYWIFPHSKLGKILKTPMVKFILHTVSYIGFILLLFFDSTLIEDRYDQSQSCNDSQRKTLCDALCSSDCLIFDMVSRSGLCSGGCNNGCLRRRVPEVSPLSTVILIFILGYFWNEIKQILQEGSNRYFSSVWNWLDICMLNLYIGYFLLNLVALQKAASAETFFNNFNDSCPTFIEPNTHVKDHIYFLSADRRLWKPADPTLIADAMFAMANVLSFTRVAFILPASEFLGPLQISLGRMLGDVTRFLIVFMVVFLAFFCATYNLYGYYAVNKGDVTDQDSGAVKAFASFQVTMLSLLWALFGLGDSSDYDIPREYKHDITQGFGTLLLLAYHFAMVLVMLNMLIAMMAASFEDIQADEDVEWKFARAKLWISYFEAGTLPVPFNLVPSPKTMWVLYKSARDRIRRWLARRRGHGLERWERKRDDSQLRVQTQTGIGGSETMLSTLGLFNISTRASMPTSAQENEDVLKGIVKRYLFRLQRDKDTDEVGEGELDEIKYDISSLRYEIMQKIDDAVEGKTGEGFGGSRGSAPKMSDRMDIVENNLFLLVGEIQKLRRDLVLNGFVERPDDEK